METLKMLLEQFTGILVSIGSTVQLVVFIIPAALLLLLYFVILNYKDHLNNSRKFQSRIGEINALPFASFKKFAGSLLTMQGYEIDRGKEDDVFSEAEDQSEHVEEEKKEPVKKEPVDYVVVKDGKRYAVMVAKKEHGVGKLFFNKLEKAMADHNCENAMIINNGSFQPDELIESELRLIDLWDRERLIKEMLHIQGKKDTQGQTYSFYFKDFFRWIFRG